MASPRLAVLAAVALSAVLLIPGAAYADPTITDSGNDDHSNSNNTTNTYVCTPTAVAIGGVNSATNDAPGGPVTGGTGGAGGATPGGVGGSASQTGVAASGDQSSDASASATCGPAPAPAPAPVIVNPAPAPAPIIVTPAPAQTFLVPGTTRTSPAPRRFTSSAGQLPSGGANTGSA